MATHPNINPPLCAPVLLRTVGSALITASCLTLLACSAADGGSTDTGTTDTGTLVDAGGDAGLDSGTDASADTGVIDGGPADTGVADTGAVDTGPPDSGQPCVGAAACGLEWAVADPYPINTDHHVSFVASSTAGDFLFVAGGVDADSLDRFSTIHRNLTRARINADGSLGSWQAQDVLPRPLAFNALTQTDDAIYTLGGISEGPSGLYLSAGVFRATINGAGEMEWQTGTGLPRAFGHATTAVLNNRLYAIGGLDGRNPQAIVLYADLGTDGLNGRWQVAPELPEPRSHHASVVHGDRIYIIGGFTTGTIPLQDILRSVHDASGVMTGWEVAGTMADPPWTHSAFVRDGRIYIAGGGQGGPGEETYVNRVRRVAVDSDGMITEAFEDLNMGLPEARSHVHQTPVFGDHVYSVGGRRLRMGSMDQTFVGAFVTP